MIIDGVELFVVNYKYDPLLKMVYAPLYSFLALIDGADVEDIFNNNESSKRYDLLNYLREKPIININNITRSLNNAVPELDIAITDNCTMNCLYCHASAGDSHKTDSMSYAKIEAILQEYFAFIRNKNPETVTIGFNGGGEPTFDMSRLEFAVKKARDLAKKYGTKCDFSMATNGYYRDDIRDYIIHNFKNVSLSFDGPEHIQNLHRPTKNGRGSFNTVYETANYFYRKNYSFAFRATVSNYSLGFIKDVVDFFANNFPNKSLGLEHLNPIGRGSLVIDERVSPPNKSDFTKELLKMLDHIEKKPFKIINSASTEFDIIRLTFCSNVGVPNWTVDTQGNILACSRDNIPDMFIFGKFDLKTNKVMLFQKKIDALKKMSVVYYDDCKDCFCKYHCAGDCADRRLSDKSDCNAIREIGSHILSQKISGNKEFNRINTLSDPLNTA